MKKIIPLALFLFPLSSFGDYSLDYQLESYSDGMPLNQLLNDGKGPAPAKGTTSHLHELRSYGERINNLAISVFYRHDRYYQHNPDTLQIYHAAQNDNVDLNDGNYQLSLSENNLKAYGLALEKYFAVTPLIKGKVGINYLYATEMRDGEISGPLTMSNGDIATLSMRGGHTYSDSPWYFIEDTNDNIGHGLSLDFDISYELNEKHTLSLASKDLISSIYWKDQSYVDIVEFNATPIDNIAFTAPVTDFDRSFITQPSKDHYQELPRRVWLSYNFNNNDYQFSSIAYWHDNFFQPIITAGVRQDFYWLNANYNLETKAAGIDFDFDFFKITASIDSLDIDKAKAFNIGFSYSY